MFETQSQEIRQHQFKWYCTFRFFAVRRTDLTTHFSFRHVIFLRSELYLPLWEIHCTWLWEKKHGILNSNQIQKRTVCLYWYIHMGNIYCLIQGKWNFVSRSVIEIFSNCVHNIAFKSVFTKFSTGRKFVFL